MPPSAAERLNDSLCEGLALRPRIPHRVWRKVHYLTLPAWLLASLHGVLAGTDAGDPWFAGIAAGAFAAVAVATAARFAPA